MHRLRSIHLYLGCIFAPLLLFFAVSGVWQMFGWHGSNSALLHLTTIHTSRALKDGSDWTSPLMFVFVLMMALAFIVTTTLGVVMAVKFGKSRKVAYWCLSMGLLIPVVLVLIRVAFGRM